LNICQYTASTYPRCIAETKKAKSNLARWINFWSQLTKYPLAIPDQLTLLNAYYFDLILVIASDFSSLIPSPDIPSFRADFFIK